MNRANVLLVAIVGGSGSGKSWLSQKLQQVLGDRAACLSQDDFYRDRSHLSPTRRARLNFDHPRALDWKLLEVVLQELSQGRTASLPSYDFCAHCRKQETKVFSPKPVVLVDGLWLLRKPALRRMFEYRIFMECPGSLRLKRRLLRDLASRGRDRQSVIRQFRETVDPMHRRYIEPQKRWADIVVTPKTSVPQVKIIRERLLRTTAAGEAGNRACG